MSEIDPVCLTHGLRKSTHFCVQCCLCFRDLTLEECHLLPDGSREDVCDECAAQDGDNPMSEAASPQWHCEHCGRSERLREPLCIDCAEVERREASASLTAITAERDALAEAGTAHEGLIHVNKDAWDDLQSQLATAQAKAALADEMRPFMDYVDLLGTEGGTPGTRTYARRRKEREAEAAEFQGIVERYDALSKDEVGNG